MTQNKASQLLHVQKMVRVPVSSYCPVFHCYSITDPLFHQDESTCKSKDLKESSDVTRRQHIPRQ